MLEDKVRETIARYDMLREGDRVAVAVSGGPDSTALLYILNALRKEYGLKLSVAHLNHMIRKTDAGKDALFVKKMAGKLKLPVVIESRDVPKIAKQRRRSLEDAARDERYDFYSRAARHFGAGKIALAHTGDDQAETVLIRLIRGSGLLGLSGMPPVRDFAGKKIIRPLIDIPKDEIMRFIKTKKIPFRIDRTNARPIYLRNRVRQRLIPVLEKFNPEIKKILKETARNTRVDYDFIAGIGEKKFKKYLHNGSGVGVDLKFLDEDTAIQRLIIREAIRAVKGNLEAVTYRHWEGLQKLLRKRTGWALDLPGGVRVRRGADALIFAKAGQESPAYPLEAFYSLKCPGVTRIPEIGVEAKADFIKSPPDFRRKRSRKEEYFDFGKLKRPVYLRFRKTGDVIRPMGMSGRKALKDLFVDEKVAPEARAKTPLLVSGDKIIWACGVKRSDEAKVSGATKKILRVRIRELKQLT